MQKGEVRRREFGIRSQESESRMRKAEVRRSDHARAHPGSVRYRRTVRTSCRERAGDARATARFADIP